MALCLVLAITASVTCAPVPSCLEAEAQAPPDHFLDLMPTYVEVYMLDQPTTAVQLHGTVSIGTSRVVTTTVALSVSCALPATISPASFTFEGSQGGDYRVDVSVPWGAIPLTWEEVWVTATLASSGQEDVTLRDNALIHINNYDLIGLGLVPEVRDIAPGEGMDLRLEVTNPSSGRLTIRITQPEPTEFITITVEPSTVVLGPSASTNVSVRVDVDGDAPSGPVEPRLWLTVLDEDGEQVHSQDYDFRVDVDYLGPPLSERLEVAVFMGFVGACVVVLAALLWFMARRLRGRKPGQGA
jgi:hypothetical protein